MILKIENFFNPAEIKISTTAYLLASNAQAKWVDRTLMNIAKKMLRGIQSVEKPSFSQAVNTVCIIQNQLLKRSRNENRSIIMVRLGIQTSLSQYYIYDCTMLVHRLASKRKAKMSSTLEPGILARYRKGGGYKMLLDFTLFENIKDAYFDKT